MHSDIAIPPVGTAVGVGVTIGDEVGTGEAVGRADAVALGFGIGDPVGPADGAPLGALVGGPELGGADGWGLPLGAVVAIADGVDVGTPAGVEPCVGFVTGGALGAVLTDGADPENVDPAPLHEASSTVARPTTTRPVGFTERLLGGCAMRERCSGTLERDVPPPYRQRT